MNDMSGMAANAFSRIAEAKANSASQQALQGKGTADRKKIEQSASDFESILLTSWLQEAEKSFATVPGGDDDGNSDPGKSQFQSYAVQAVASALTKAGGIGLASMIASGLAKAANTQAATENVSEKP